MRVFTLLGGMFLNLAAPLYWFEGLLYVFDFLLFLSLIALLSTKENHFSLKIPILSTIIFYVVIVYWN